MRSGRHRLPRAVKVIIGLSVLFTIGVGASVGLALWPTQLDRIKTTLPAFSERSGRRTVECEQSLARYTCRGEVSTGDTIEGEIPARDGLMLNGALTLPEGLPPPFPAVLLVGGSGGHPRDPETRGGILVHHAPFRLYGALRDLFVSLGFAVLMYDKRTCRTCYADYPLDRTSFRFGHFGDDARSALSWLREQPQIDANALVVVGHSQGGAIVARLAPVEDGIAALIMLAGSTRSFGDALANQQRRVATLRADQNDWIGAALLRFQARRFESCLAEARSSPNSPSSCLKGITAAAFDEEEAASKSTRPALEQLGVPFLAMQGQLDHNIDPRVLEELRVAIHNRDAEVHRIAAVGHSFVHENDLDSPQLAVRARELLRDFLRSVPARSLQ